MAITHTHQKSSWIATVAYRRLNDGTATGGTVYLALFLSSDKAILLAYPQIPSWVPGLLSAGVSAKGKSRSTGRAYNRVLKGKYPSQTVEGSAQVAKLAEMMGV